MFRRSARETTAVIYYIHPFIEIPKLRTISFHNSADFRPREDTFLAVEDQWGLPVDRDQRYRNLEFLAASQYFRTVAMKLYNLNYDGTDALFEQ